MVLLDWIWSSVHVSIVGGGRGADLARAHPLSLGQLEPPGQHPHPHPANSSRPSLEYFGASSHLPPLSLTPWLLAQLEHQLSPNPQFLLLHWDDFTYWWIQWQALRIGFSSTWWVGGMCEIDAMNISLGTFKFNPKPRSWEKIVEALLQHLEVCSNMW